MTVQTIGVLLAVLGQGPTGTPPASTGAPQCDRYVSMVRSCLPKMCEEERALREMELGFALEAIAAQVTHKGTAAADATCSADITAEVAEDLYGCHSGSRASAILVEAEPSKTSVRLRFSGSSVGAVPLDVALAVPLEPDPAAVYRVTPSGGAYVLDTASAVAAAAGRVVLERDTPYCYSIATPDGGSGGGTVIRKGAFTTK